MRGLSGRCTVSAGCIVHAAGAATVVRSGDLDLEALDPVRRGAALAAFTRHCHTLDTPLQILVRSEPVEDAASDAAGALDDAMRRHRARRLAETSAHRRDIFFVSLGRDTSSSHAAAQRTLEMLRVVGCDGSLLSESELHALLQREALDAQWQETAGWVRCQDRLTAGYAMRSLPGHAVTAGWLRPLLTMRSRCDAAVHLAPAPLGVALRTLGRRLRDFSAHRMLEFERGAVNDVHVDIGLDAAVELRGRLARRHGQPLHMSIVAVVTAATGPELAVARRQLRDAFQAALLGLEPLHLRSAAARLSTLPLGIDAVGAPKLVDSTAAASCAPWLEARCDDPGGYRLGETRAGQQPVRLAPFHTARHQNANIAVFASSGHGKSFALGVLVIEAALRGVDAVILDPEGEHRRVVETLGGIYLSLTPGSDAALNIFDCAGDGEAAVAGVTELVSVFCGRLAEVDRAHVDAAAREALARAAVERRAALLEDCLPALQHTAPHVAVVLRRHCTGALGALFNRPTSVRVGSGVCGISLRDMPPEHTAATTLVLARLLWALVQHTPRRRHIVVDEAGALCVHPALRSLLVQLARRCRKYGSSLVVATQNAQDLLGHDEGAVVATNAAIVMLGRQRPAEASRMESAFGLTPGQRRFVETAGRGEFLLLAGDRRMEVVIDVPDAYGNVLRDSARTHRLESTTRRAAPFVGER